jgi:ubiquinone/menaquinone biosynthesis C-methylase UbiE
VTAELWDLVSDAYAADIAPQLEPIARDALALVGVAPGARVIDVGAGPGTLALLAAAAGAEVTAVDVAPAMIEALRRSAAGLRIDARVEDGQALSAPDAAFDRAFSIFGVIFFPDVAAGLRELARVLVAGGRAVVTSWPAMAPPLAAMMASVRAEAGATGAPPALGTAETLRDALLAAGFAAAEVETRDYPQTAPSSDALWSMLERTMMPLLLLARRLGPAWPRVADIGRARLARELGPGPVSVPLRALFGVATR